MEEFNYFYNLSNYDSKSNLNFIKNKKSGIKNPKICIKCNHVCFNHLNLRHHILTQHSTIEDREKEKYYCKVCDKVFFCKYYIDLHMKSMKHNNKINSNTF